MPTPTAPMLGGVVRHAWVGLGAGLLAGAAVGLFEMTYVLLRITPPRPWGSLGYAMA